MTELNYEYFDNEIFKNKWIEFMNNKKIDQFDETDREQLKEKLNYLKDIEIKTGKTNDETEYIFHKDNLLKLKRLPFFEALNNKPLEVPEDLDLGSGSESESESESVTVPIVITIYI